VEVSGSAMKGYENYKELHLRQPGETQNKYVPHEN